MATAERPRTGDADPRGRERRMSLGAHLRELRKRLVFAAAALLAGMVVAFFVTDPVIELISAPIREIAERTGDTDRVNLMFTTVTAAFDLRLRMSFAIGLLLSAPVWLWQIWAFVMPGLTRKEVKYTIGFVLAATPLFFTGAWVGLLMMPHIVELMFTFVPDGGIANYDANYYYDFVFKLLIVVGVAFVLPVFLVALNLAGVMSGRAILKGWRVAIIVAVVFAALATPAADIVSMLLLSGILIALFFAAALLSLLFDRRRARRDAAILLPGSPA